jgi:hypothetical protein
VRWPLQPLLALRRREESAANQAWVRALASRRGREAEALALRRLAAERLARAGRAGAGAGIEAARWGARLRLEAEGCRARAAGAEGRVRVEAPAEEARRAALLQAARARELVERLEAAWRRARALEAARRAEAALDDRPWPAPGGVARPG